MKYNMNDWIKSISASINRKAMPVLSYPGAGMRGITITDVVNNGDAQYACIKAISDAYPSIAALTCMDLSVEAEAFGSLIKFQDNEIPTVVRGAIGDLYKTDELPVPAVGSGRTSPYLKAVRLSAEAIRDRPTFAGMIGPFSLAGRLFDMTEIMIAIKLDVAKSHLLLSKSARFLADYAKAFKAAGANGIIIAEPAAGLLSPQDCQEFSSDYIKKIVLDVQDDTFMVILHNCGNTTNLVGSMLSTGCMGYHFGNAVDMKDIMPRIPPDRIAFGNIDPSGVLKNSSADNVTLKTRELLLDMAPYKNFILSSGCDIPAGTPSENIDAFFNALEWFNKDNR